MATLDTRAARGRSEHRFFGGTVALIAATIFLGFARSYYLRPLVAPPAVFAERGLTPLIHVHAALFTGWIVLLVAQARLVAARRVDLHRRLGVLGAVLAALMRVSGALTALHGVLRGVAPGGGDPRRFLVMPLFALLVFAALFVAALQARRTPQAHKRLMLLATIALLPPALARYVIFYLGFGPPVVAGLSVLFVVPLVAWDLRTLGRLHPATLWGGLVVVGSIPLRLAIGSTAGWLAFTDWAVGLVR
jgi:hypothetical protein